MAQPLQVSDLDGFTASDAALRRAGAGKAEVILARAGLLLAGDRALLEGIYMNGLSLKAVARASGASPRRVVYVESCPPPVVVRRPVIVINAGRHHGHHHHHRAHGHRGNRGHHGHHR